MLIVIGSGRSRQGQHHELVSAARAVALATRVDDGCDVYTFAVDVTEPAAVVSFEVWRDRAALEAHLSHEHTQRFLRDVAGLLEGEPTMSLFEATPTELTGHQS